MKRNVQRLRIQQLDRKYALLSGLAEGTATAESWLRTVRTALGMSLKQFGARLGLSRQGAAKLEQREAAGSITLNSLREAANALDLEFVYALVPRAGSLEAMIDQRARALAREIVARTSQSMKLEGQENERQRIEKAVEEAAYELKREMPRYLWD